MELEEDTSEREVAAREVGEAKAATVSDRAILKIDITANRYDLLCPEGIAKALLIFQDKMTPPIYRCVDPPNGAYQKIRVHAEVQ
jgi:phenylalanyl-tRNA synthetase beta chain